jgi:hypothetical protein
MSEETQAEQGNTETASGNEQQAAGQETEQQQAAATETTEGTETSAEVIEYQDFTVPEGIELSPTVLDKFKPFAQELKLDQGKAQQLVDMGSELAAEIHKQGIENWKAQIEGWKQETIADKDLGGKNFDENLGIAQKALDEFGDDELKDILAKTGLNNHRAVVRLLHKFGKAIGSDTFVAGQHKAARSTEQVLYPTMNQQ